MLDRPQVAEIPGTLPHDNAGLHCLTPCDPTALNRLVTALEDASPGAFLIGDGVARPAKVLENFLAGVDEHATVAYVSGPCTDATSWMRNVIRAIGFKAKDFCLTDLENIFGMFLSFQRSHDQRTVMIIEDAQDCSSWVFDKVFELVELELQERYGLFVILSWQTTLTDRLTVNSDRLTAPPAMRDIPVSPLKLVETREFVVQQVRSAGLDDVSQVFEYEAITTLHEISAGIPDTVFRLCGESLRMAARKSAYPVAASAVGEAASALGLVPDDLPLLEEEPECVDQVAGNSIKLSVRLRGEANRELTFIQDCLSIGRGAKNDVCIPSLLVSRHHAVMVKSSEGVRLMDLGSTNGCIVNGEKVNSRCLVSGDTIILGDCRIDFAITEHTLDEIIMADLASSGVPDEQDVANDAVVIGQWSNGLLKIRGSRNPAVPLDVREATTNRGQDDRDSRVQEETR